MADFTKAFDSVHIVQSIQREETILAGVLAVDRVRVYTRVVNRDDGATCEYNSHTLTILPKDEDGDWRVSRSIGVIEKH